MQRRITNLRRSDDEVVKEGGLLLDFDEIARHGAMTLEESKVAKAYGIYTTRHPNYFMARIVVPGGVLTTSQVRGLSRIIEAYGQGRICLTTRQALQVHYLRLGDIAPLMRDLAKCSLTTFHGCGDNIRNTVACPWASVCPHRRFDVLPYVHRTAELINACRDLDNLPRKFKISYSGCQGNCAQPSINCVGIVAVVRKRPDGSQQTGFRVGIGGGMGWRPQLGRLLYGFVPKDKIQPLCRAVTMLYRDHGDRFNRGMARLKVVVERLGIDRCRAIVEGFLGAAGVDYSEFEKGVVEDCGPAVPPRPMAEPCPRGDDGKAIARIMVSKGEIDFHSLKRIAEPQRALRRQVRLHHQSPEFRAARRRCGQAARAASGDPQPAGRPGNVFRAGRHRTVRRYHLLSACRFRDAPFVRPAGERRQARQVRRHPGQGRHQHHRLPELLLALLHRRHRPARLAHPRVPGLRRRL